MFKSARPVMKLVIIVIKESKPFFYNIRGIRADGLPSGILFAGLGLQYLHSVKPSYLLVLLGRNRISLLT